MASPSAVLLSAESVKVDVKIRSSAMPEGFASIFFPESATGTDRLFTASAKT
jgi:hypothetical protein